MDERIWHITSFYKFFSMDQEKIDSAKQLLEGHGANLGMRGLVLLAPEGINGTVAGSTSAMKEYTTLIETIAGPLSFKNSTSAISPFRRYHVKIREEIVQCGNPNFCADDAQYLSTNDWNAILASEDVIVLDVRNSYETEIGMFDGAIDPRLRTFQEFPEWVEHCGIPKSKKVLMYCTGGIRCEKASSAMRRKGYEQIYQLKGGILKYLEEQPEGSFKGECFVFDHRTAVDKRLQPSKRFALCPHCGDPGDREVICKRCARTAKICQRCVERMHCIACSKDCAYHIQCAQKRLIKK